MTREEGVLLSDAGGPSAAELRLHDAGDGCVLLREWYPDGAGGWTPHLSGALHPSVFGRLTDELRKRDGGAARAKLIAAVRNLLAPSDRWGKLVADLPLMAVAKLPPLDLASCTCDELREIEAWARGDGGDALPNLIAKYLQAIAAYPKP